jgi:hypothetical protein
VRIDPGLDVGHHGFLVGVVEEIVEAALVQLQRLVGRPGGVENSWLPLDLVALSDVPGFFGPVLTGK